MMHLLSKSFNTLPKNIHEKVFGKVIIGLKTQEKKLTTNGFIEFINN